MRNSRVGINIATSLLQQAVAVICGFIVPRLILNAYGSAYNGIVSSVSQFLSCVTLLRAGIGGVTRAALYKSLEANEPDKTAAIIKATELFMRKIALIFIVALLGFAALYPLLVKEEFDWLFSFTLVLILGISTVVQYYFGIANQFLLHADQRLYIINLWQIAGVLLNSLLTVFLIRAGYGIHMAKLGSAAAFSIQPVVLYLYVRRQYRFKKNIAPDFGAIQQRWDAFAHQLSAFAHSNTDVMVLTFFADLRQVSVYTVYTMIAGGINMLIASAANAVEAVLGKTLAKADQRLLREKVGLYELLMHLAGTILFSCTAILIVPFVMVYTTGIYDVDYNQPLLGYLMCLAYWLSAIRLPYQNVIEAAGHFKQTKNMAIIETVLNIVLSCALVMACGTVGVVIGTVVAMGYRTVCYAIYAREKLLGQSILGFVKRIFASILSLTLIFLPLFCFNIPTNLLLFVSNYAEWIVAATVVFCYVTVVAVAVNVACYYDKIRKLICMFVKK